MRFRLERIPTVLGAALLLSPLANGAEKYAKPDPNGLAPIVVQDLHYGDVLFYFYQDDYFAAITRLLAARQQGHITHHQEEAELLLGGLYLSLGQHVEAGRIFEALLARNTSQNVRNRAWYYLGKVWYQRGYLVESEKALRQINGSMDGRIDAERYMLLAQVLMLEDRYDEAIAVLRDYKGPADWTAYARFNLGVALVRKNRLGEAMPFLDGVGQLESSSEEMLSLRDKANLALGFALLQANRPAEAKPFLQRVRLEGAFSNKALLGVGWADAQGDEYKRALSPWLALHGRNLLDAAVQESYLSVPYAFSKLGATGQAADYYNIAVQSFDAETLRIDASIAEIRAGKMLDRLLQPPARPGPAAPSGAPAASGSVSPSGAPVVPGSAAQSGSAAPDGTVAHSEPAANVGWFWQLKNLPDAPESRYLYELLASNRFQEGLKNYRDLDYMRRNIDSWRDSVGAFDDMLATREKAYEERIPRADAVMHATDLNALTRKRVDFESRLNEIEKSGDVAALGTADEQRTWARLKRIEDYLASHPDDPDLAEMREKHRLMKGVLYWRMSESFKARLWNQRRSVKELEADLKETQKRAVLVQQARAAAPEHTGDYAKRVADVRARMDDLQRRLAVAAERESRYLQVIAIDALESQKQRIATYQVQARFALAAIYDRTLSAPAQGKAAPKETPR